MNCILYSWLVSLLFILVIDPYFLFKVFSFTFNRAVILFTNKLLGICCVNTLIQVYI